MEVRTKGIAAHAMLRQMAIMNAAPYCGQADSPRGNPRAKYPPSFPPDGSPLLSSDIPITLQMF
jgi:hypothetical protein